MELPPKPEHIHNLEFLRIVTPYVFTGHIVASKPVLDVGSGSGYGPWLLIANGAQLVAALDLDETKAHQGFRLCGKFESFGALVMDAQRIGFRDHSFQVVTCFEVIEHVPRTDMLLSELRRILEADGVLLLTTCNRAVRLLPLQRPWNPEHVREYTAKGLERTLRKHFPSFTVLGVYGESGPYEFYRRMWRQSAFHVYFGWARQIIRVLTPPPVRRRIKKQRSHANSVSSAGSDSHLLNIAIPVPDLENWPFYVSDVNEHCLNFFAICGFDAQIVKRTASQIKGGKRYARINCNNIR